MNQSNTVSLFCILFSLLIVLATVSAAPYSDYDNNINDLYEILMQRDNMDDHLGLHQVVRKSRGPQLRLRFGKRPDTGFEGIGERHPSLRLRFGKRSEDSPAPVSAFMTGISSDGEN